MAETADLDALDVVPEAVVVLSADRRIRHVNDRATALLGIRDAAGEPFSKVVVLEDDSGERCDEQLLDPPPVADRLAERVLRVLLPDGRRRPVAVTGRTVGEQLVLTFRNASRRERLDAARSDLVATVSHEIRSPLTSVKGFTRTLLSKWDRFTDEQKHAMLETINADADRVTRLLTELLDVSRIDAGRLELKKQTVDVPQIIERVMAKAAQRPEGEDREVKAEIGEALPDLHADPDKLEQILTNLVENALQYAPDSHVLIRAEGRDDGVLLTVADDGPGIPADQRARIFEKFGRGRGTRRAGTGLGLFITRGLARAHGGDVELESTEGEGATFRVWLPAGGVEVPAALAGGS